MPDNNGRDAVRRKVEDRVVALVNLERRRRGLCLLEIDERLRRSARWHSADMATRSFFAHQHPRGPSPSERMFAAGVKDPAGENIAVGHETPAHVMNHWMRSIPHRRNILNEQFRTIGVGMHTDHAGPFWTQNFGYR